VSKRRVLIPARNKHVVIGACKLSKHDPVGLRFRDFLHPLVAYPSSPAMEDFSGPAMSVITNIEGNDQYGDCVEAEDAHYIAVATGNSGNGLFSYTVQQTEADYSSLTGFNPNDPNTDQGTDPTQDLNWRVKVGYADGSKDAGWALVDATNKAEVMYAISTFGNLKMWFGIPNSIVQNLPGSSGFVWDVAAGAADQNNGHCIGSCGYNPIKFVGVTAQGLLVMTWGMLGIVTWEALDAWFVPSQGGGLAVRVTMDWVNKASGKTVTGMNVSAFVTAFNAFFGGNLPVPAPPPGPSPSPTPTPVPGGPSLAQAQAAMVGAFGHFPLITTSAAVRDSQAALVPLWTP
jgi:hypothetical protein